MSMLKLLYLFALKEDLIEKLTIGYVVRKLVRIGLDRMVDSWNLHKIPGPNRGIPYRRANDLILEYRANGGRTNSNMSDLYPLIDLGSSIRLLRLLDETFHQRHYVECYDMTLNGDLMILFEFIRAHYQIINNNNWTYY